MRFAALPAAVLLSSASAFTPADTAGTDALFAKAQCNLQELHPPQYGYTQAPKCSPRTAMVRKEWTTLEPQEKRSLLDAVLCLQRLPSISGDLAPGARSRYDDFVATHVNQTTRIHGTVCRNPSYLGDSSLTKYRATSCRGIDTSLGSTNMLFVTNVATKVLCHTSRSQDTHSISSTHHFSTAVTYRLAATGRQMHQIMERTSQAMLHRTL